MTRSRKSVGVPGIVREHTAEVLRFLVWILPALVLVVLWQVFGENLLVLITESARTEGWPSTISALVLAYLLLRVLAKVLTFSTRRRRLHAHASSSTRSIHRELQPDADLDVDPTQDRRARHEAAHALMIWLRGGTVSRLDLVLTGEHGGVCSWHEDASTSVLDLAWTELLCAVAGNEIDLREGHRDGGSRTDMNNALGAAATILSIGQVPAGVDLQLSTDSLLASARAQVRTALDEHRWFVDEVAQRLQAAPGTIWRYPDFSTLKGAGAANG